MSENRNAFQKYFGKPIENHKKKTALVLGGGGSRGAYQVGVWQALNELGIKPDLVVGTSVGAINSAMIAQGDVDFTAKLWKELETNVVFDVPKNFEAKDYVKEILVNHGVGSSALKALLDKYIDEDKVRNSPLEMGITATEISKTNGFRNHKLFLEDIPKGKLIDFIIASASAFPVVQAYKIDGTDYIDGGYSDVLPVSMANLKNATDVIAVNLHGFGQIKTEDLEKAKNLVLIESAWDLGFQFIFDPDHTRKIIRLGYLDALKSFHVLEGKYYAFAVGAFPKSSLGDADSCAKIFNINPEIIYTHDTFTASLRDAVEKAVAESEEQIKKFESVNWIKVRDFKKLQDEIKGIVPIDRVSTIVIANYIKANGKGTIFDTKAAKLILKSEITAANFLIKNEIL